jgi:hypothetical protein
VPVSIGVRPPSASGLPPDRACDENPLAGFSPGPGVTLPIDAGLLVK